MPTIVEHIADLPSRVKRKDLDLSEEKGWNLLKADLKIATYRKRLIRNDECVRLVFLNRSLVSQNHL